MKVFVSGGAGFIGSHFVTQILNNELASEVTVYDNFSSGTKEHLSHLASNSKLRIVEGELSDLNKLIAAMYDSQLVAHFAANPDISKAVIKPDIDFWQGTYLTQNLLEGIRLNKVPNLLYTSGSGIYGEVPGQVFQESFGPCFPISTYGASKLACEALISAYSHMFEFKSRAFRFANVVGSRQTHGVGFDFVRRLILNPNELRILGDGQQTKSYIHVQDVLEAMFLVHKLSQESNIKFDVYNVATDDLISVKEIADIACEVVGLDPVKVKYSFTGEDRGWKGDVPKVQLNSKKLKDLGWLPIRSTSEAIKDSIASMFLEITN